MKKVEPAKFSCISTSPISGGSLHCPHCGATPELPEVE